MFCAVCKIVSCTDPFSWRKCLEIGVSGKRLGLGLGSDESQFWGG